MRSPIRLLPPVLATLLLALLYPVLAQAHQSRLSKPSDSLTSVLASVPVEEEEPSEELTQAEEEEELALEAEAESEEGGFEEAEQSAGVAGHRSAKKCVVPALEGESLSGARVALSKAHCKLGKVSESHSHHHLVVVQQSQTQGRQLRYGALVAVRLSSVGKTGVHHLKLK
jgi:hypothetical protein